MPTRDATGFLETLRKASVFSTLGPRQLPMLARHMQPRDLAAGDVLFEQGAEGDSMVVVVQGRLDIRVAVDDDEVSIYPLWPGDVVGEMACLDRAPRSATVTAGVSTVVAEIDRRVLSAVWRQAPAVGTRLVQGIARTVASRLRKTNHHIETTIAHIAGDPVVSEETSEYLGSRRPRSREIRRRPVPSRHRGELDVAALVEVSGLREDDLEALADIADVHVWKPGASVFEEGDSGDDCVLVVEGEVEISKAAGTKSRVVAVLGAGTLVGQLGLVDRDTRSASVRAKGRVVGLQFSRGDLEELLRDGDPLGVRLLTLAAVATIRQLRIATRRLAELRRTRESVKRSHTARRQRVARGADPSIQPIPAEPPEEDAEATLENALRGSGMSLSILDQIEVSVPDGQMSAAEQKARSRYR